MRFEKIIIYITLLFLTNEGIYHFIISDNNGNMIQQKVLK